MMEAGIVAARTAEARESLVVALDFPSAALALDLVDRLEGTCRWFKVGMELYYAEGNSIVTRLRERGFEVFLDLKLHDIPNTVAGAVRTAGAAGASLLNVHACGGLAMMQAAVEAASLIPDRPKLLAVTVLTSMDREALTGVGVQATPADQVLRLAQLARSAGVDGLVCSAEEVAAMRGLMGADAVLVTPGIRPKGAALGDQQRVATPGDAIAWGASKIVVGRPIAQASDPARMTTEILAEMEAVHSAS